jgi:hypothetical protein
MHFIDRNFLKWNKIINGFDFEIQFFNRKTNTFQDNLNLSVKQGFYQTKLWKYI